MAMDRELDAAITTNDDYLGWTRQAMKERIKELQAEIARLEVQIQRRKKENSDIRNEMERLQEIERISSDD